MVWGAVSFYEQYELVFVNGNLNSKQNCAILAVRILSMAAETFGESKPWIFQHDGASIHRSVYTVFWFSGHTVICLKWLTKSPHLNTIENVWDLMDCHVYNS